MQDSELTPKQARSRESQQKILDATLLLLEDRHFEAMTIADIADAAGMAVGNFYKRFKNKESLLPHLYEEYNRRFAEFAEPFLQPSNDKSWRSIVEKTVTFFDSNKGLIRALHLHSRLNPDLVPEGSTQKRSGIYQALESQMSQTSMDPHTRKRRARLAAHVIVSSATEAILYPNLTPTAATRLNKTHLITGLTELLDGYTN